MQLNSNTTTHKPESPTVRPCCLTGWAATIAVAFAALPAAFAQPSYFVTELPTPAGYESSSPYQINDQGFVVGGSSRGSDLVATVLTPGQ